MTPEEAQAEHERREMEFSSARHRVMNFIHSLSSDDLETFGIMTSMFADPEMGHVIANQYLGLVSTVQHFKFSRCVCGADHGDPTLAAAHDTERLEAELANNVVLAHNSDPVMIEYRLEMRADRKFYCKGCGHQYVSLEDRMLRRPDDCSGCHMKSMHG